MESLCRETGLNWNLIATPNKGTALRFARLDKKEFGIVPGVTDREKYTESFLVPDDGSVDVYQRIQLEAPYHALTLGGHLCRASLDGGEEELEQVLRAMKEAGVGYAIAGPREIYQSAAGQAL